MTKYKASIILTLMVTLIFSWKWLLLIYVDTFSPKLNVHGKTYLTVKGVTFVATWCDKTTTCALLNDPGVLRYIDLSDHNFSDQPKESAGSVVIRNKKTNELKPEKTEWFRPPRRNSVKLIKMDGNIGILTDVLVIAKSFRKDFELMDSIPAKTEGEIIFGRSRTDASKIIKIERAPKENQTSVLDFKNTLSLIKRAEVMSVLKSWGI